MTKARKEEIENRKESGPFAGIINGIILSLPFWGFVIYVVWRW